MLKILFIFFLLVYQCAANAEWLEVGFSEQRSFRMFYDSSSIGKIGDIATVRVLKNFKESRKSVDPKKQYTFISQTSIQEIDCVTSKYRTKEISMWSELNAMGRLEQTHYYAANDWGQVVKAKSLESAIIGKACN